MAAVLLLGLAGCGRTGDPREPLRIAPALTFEAVGDDPDDPAIWVHPQDPARSLILGTNKAQAPNGALVVYGVDGRIRQTISGLDRPNNADIAKNFTLGGEVVDLVVVTERNQSRLRTFLIPRDGGGLRDVSDLDGLRVFAGERDREAAPMGIAMYREFAIVSRKTGPSGRYLWQYRLRDNGAGKVRAEKVREFGNFAGRPGSEDEIEAVAVDAELGFVYYSDENAGVRKYHADPAHPDAGRELAFFATSGFRMQREGIAIYPTAPGQGYLLVTDQIPGGTRYVVYRREGEVGSPHDHSKVLAILSGGADSTDGIEATAQSLGPAFAEGILVAMNSGARNFLGFRGADIRRAIESRRR
ncbi:MAG: phytase [Bryobacteraceae bacterium]|nr:phytase [Bryobacteraceae bacterium]